MAAPSPAAQDARATRKAEAQDARARRILDAARDVLAGTGIQGLTMRAVAGRAGYTAGAVYSYFASKEALLAALAADEMDRAARTLKETARGGGGDGGTGGADMEALAPVLAAALRRVVPLLTAARRGDVPAETERALTGRIIRILHILDAAAGPGGLRETGPEGNAADTLALWSGLVGLALLAWSGRFESLGVAEEAVAAALAARFS